MEFELSYWNVAVLHISHYSTDLSVVEPVNLSINNTTFKEVPVV